MPLEECMRKTSHKHYLVWQEYLKRQWEKPSRSDHYLMVIAQEVRRVLSKNPKDIKLSHFKLKWTWKSVSERVKAVKQRAYSASQSFWIGVTGAQVPEDKQDGD